MQNSDSKEDLRVRRSRKMLQEALIELTVEKKGFGDVTIREITERAMVNRSTFYRHFLDKCDLVEQYMDDVYAMISTDEKVVMPIDGTQVKNLVPIGLIKLIEHVQEFAEFYRIMLGINGDQGFTERFRQNSERRFHMVLQNAEQQQGRSELPLEMRVKYVSHAGVGAIVWWLENDQPCSVEDLANWISQLSFPIWSGRAG